MHNLVNTNFNMTYNPSGRQNALSDIKRLLTSRDTLSQNKACGYLTHLISRYNPSSKERSYMIDYLLNNDITLFLCEATSNLDFTLFRSCLACLRLLWEEKRFFLESHGSQSLSAALRALAHYARSGASVAVDFCLHFICDLIACISTHGTVSPLSHQSTYSAEQLLACLNALSPHISTNSNTIMSTTILLHSLLFYKPEDLELTGGIGSALEEILSKWFSLLLSAINHSMLAGDGETGLYFGITCYLGLDALGITKILSHGQQKKDFIRSILADKKDIELLNKSATELKSCIETILAELIVFAKENQEIMSATEYSVFLKFIFSYLNDNTDLENNEEFCDLLYTKGYLTLLTQKQIVRNDVTIRKQSILVLGEMLKVLSKKYLNFNEHGDDTCVQVIHNGLVELQKGINKPQDIGFYLQKSQPYSLLIFIYFYCQSTENPEEITAPLLPYLVEHIILLSKSTKPPSFIIKALWLVFAMSAISNGTIESLEDRVYLEKASERIVEMLHPNPAQFYTHNPALLLWAFTSNRIPQSVRSQVMSEWLSLEELLPTDLSNEPIVWELLLDILCQVNDNIVATNCIKALQVCIKDSDDDCTKTFSLMIWTTLPTVLSRILIDYDLEKERNVKYLIFLATTVIPSELDQDTSLKIASLIMIIFVKSNPNNYDIIDTRNLFDLACLKISLCLLGLNNTNGDNKVLLTYTNCTGFLSRVLMSTQSFDDNVACSAAQLLSYIVHYSTNINLKPNTILQLQTPEIIKSLRNNNDNARGVLFLQLVYMVLNAGAAAPVTLSDNFLGNNEHCWEALRALMFRIQMMCCRESSNQSSSGWKALSSIFKYAVISKNDQKLITLLTSQPWTLYLIQFQLTQNTSLEFLTFLDNWLTLLNITLKKALDPRRKLSKISLVVKTMFMTKKFMVKDIDDEFMELKNKVLLVTNEVLQVTNNLI